MCEYCGKRRVFDKSAEVLFETYRMIAEMISVLDVDSSEPILQSEKLREERGVVLSRALYFSKNVPHLCLEPEILSASELITKITPPLDSKSPLPPIISGRST